ncbi:DUF4377 domain-containing protein [Spirosoma sp. KUDC1026]|uniref:DUF4377 domain-containing protein n=1 Tax=Spirosoma sp. KUDC1026 TaxID=2745947 RepID=UPI00159BE70F|nr:DUF4377 domain-containing protein [Spirosoma sp. KUDC1026]QKZ15074.1 DUF4377 domain-containing protein [Spirosoma sp. KUDC1026]
MAIIRVLTLLLLLAGSACDKSVDPETLTLQIDSQYQDCVGVGPRKCLRVKENDASKWQLFYDPIEGFIHEPGYSYTIQVSREVIPDPPTDGSSYRYKLIQVVNQQKQ